MFAMIIKHLKCSQNHVVFARKEMISATWDSLRKSILKKIQYSILYPFFQFAKKFDRSMYVYVWQTNGWMDYWKSHNFTFKDRYWKKYFQFTAKNKINYSIVNRIFNISMRNIFNTENEKNTIQGINSWSRSIEIDLIILTYILNKLLKIKVAYMFTICLKILTHII